MRVLALIRGGIGEQILFFPTLDDLARNYPHAQIDVVIEPRAQSAYRMSKSIRNVLIFDFKDRNSTADWVNLVGMIREREYDIAIAPGKSWLLGLILWLTGIPIRIGFKGGGTSFITSPVPLNPHQYAAKMYHDLLQGLGIKSPCPDLAVNIPKSDIDWSRLEQKRLSIGESGYVLIHGISNYPIENWQHIIQDFQQKQPSISLVVAKDAGDSVLYSTLVETGFNIKLTSPEDAGKLASMIAGASLTLSADNASTQLAVAVQTYTIALLAEAEPSKVLPKSDKFLGIKSPTGKMADISPKTVLEKIWGG